MFLNYIDPGSGFVITSFGAGLIAFLLSFFGIFALFFKKIIRFIKKYKKLFLLILIILIISILAIIGVAMKSKDSQFKNKIIILGFDGLSPKIIEPMIEKGELPNFAKLKKQGSYHRLTTTNPPQSPVAWTGFATGQNPGKNGIFDFIIRDPKTYGLKLSLSTIENGKAKKVIKSKCFWEYATDKNIPTTIISHPITFPPDKISGRMLSGMGVTDILGTEGTFTFYTTEKSNKEKETGGKTFYVKKSSVMFLDLIGPKISSKKMPENTKVPISIFLKDKNTITIKCQNDKFDLDAGQWSGWKEVTFNLGLFKKIKGIFKFYLVEADPELKLYISPINFDPRNPFFPISYPKNYSKELVSNIGLFYTQGMPMHTWAVNEKRLKEKAFLQEAKEVLNERKAMLNFELARFKKGILFCYFESSDIVQHMFWRYIDPQHPIHNPDAPEKYKNTIKTWYKHMDQILGETLKHINEDDTLIVLSDHGFDTFRRSVHINSWLRKNGFLTLKDPDARESQELLTGIDWSKTKAYSIGFGAIYINQKGREGEGIVEPGEETELIKKQISNGLSKWRDDKYEKDIISKVYKKEEIFWGKFINNMPDLYVGFNTGYRASWQTALGASPEKLLENNTKKWSGSHLFDPALIPGVIFSNKKIENSSPSLYDITPSILKTIGYNDEEMKSFDLDGTPLFK